MTSNDDSMISGLNALLKNRLTAINQYFLHARMLKHRGELQLADHEYKASIEAMKHADMLVEHILVQGGAPELQELDRLCIGAAASEMLKNDLALAEHANAQAESLIRGCEGRGDGKTAALLSRIADSQRELIGFIRRF